MKKNGFLVLLLLVVAAAAALSILLFFRRDGGAAGPEPTPAPEWTAPPERTSEPAPAGLPEPAETPEPTKAPDPTLQPAATPEPTPAPTPRPADASGSFSSDTGTALNLLVNWAVYTDGGGSRKMEVALSAAHYALHTDYSAYALSLTVGGRSYSADCAAIQYDGAERTVTPLHVFTLEAPSGSAGIEAVWHFKGSYSGKELERITASGTADIR